MPEPVAVAPVSVEPAAKPKIAHLEVLSFGGETRVGSRNRIIRESQRKAAEVRDLRAKEENPRDAIEALTKSTREASFGKDSAQAMKEGFSTDEIKDNAAKLIDQISDFTLYSEIKRQIEQTGNSLDDVLRGHGMTRNAWFNMRGRALDLLLTQDSLKNMFPELEEIASARGKRNFIEITLGSDPLLRDKIVEKMRTLADQTQELEEVSGGAEYEAAQKKQKIADESQNGAINRVLDEVMTIFQLSPEDQMKLGVNIKRELITGRSPKAIVSVLREHFLTSGLGDKRNAIEEWQKQKQAETAAFEEIKAMDKDPHHSTTRKVVDDKLVAIRARIAELEGTTYFTDKDDFSKSLALYEKISTTLSGEVDQTGAFESIAAQDLKAAADLQITLDEVNQQLAENSAAGEKALKASKLKRLRDETDILRDLENVISSSIGDVLLQRYDDMIDLMEAKVRKDTIERSSTAVDAVNADMRTRWIEYRQAGRSRATHAENIRNDMTYLTYAGEDGLRRLILRSLSLTDADGNPIDYQTVDLKTELSDENKALLEATFRATGDSFRDKLFADYFVARSQLTLRRTLSMKAHEWTLLEVNFGEGINVALGKSTIAKTRLAEMRAEGIIPTFKMKWLLYLAAILGMVGATALGGPVGTAAGATALAGVGAAHGVIEGKI